MSDNKNLKPGWKVWRFEQMATNVNVRIDNPSESGMEHYIGLEHLDADSLKIRRWGTPDDVEATKLMFKKGDIIFGRRRAYQRKLGVAEFDGICSAHAMVLRAKPEVVLPEFLPFFMQSDLFMKRAVEISVGSLSPTINWKTMAIQEFALPPIEEQRALLDVLQQIEGTIETTLFLHTAAVNLAKSQIADEFSTLQKAPIGAVCKLRGGNAFGPQMQGRKSGEIPFIKVSDMNLPANRITLFEAENYVNADDLQKMRAKPFEAGAVVFAKVGAALFLNRRRIIVAPTCIDNNMMGAIPDGSKIISEFLYLVLQQIDFKTIVQEGAIPSVNQGTLEKVMIPFTTLERQKEIVSRWYQTDEAIQKINARLEAHRQLKRQALILAGGGHN